jgi:hypothetical protein
MFRIIIPLVVGHTLVSRCPSVETTHEPIQNSIRQLMWPVLLVAMGFAWYVTRSSAKNGGLSVDGAFGVLTGLLMWWLHTHFCKDDPEQAKLILVLVAAATGAVTYIAGSKNPMASIMLLPMLVWILFAERLQIPKLRIRLPSIKIKLPSVQVTKNGGPAVALVTNGNGNGAPAPATEQPTQTSDGVPKASTSTPVPAKPAVVADVITPHTTQPTHEGFW